MKDINVSCGTTIEKYYKKDIGYFSTRGLDTLCTLYRIVVHYNVISYKSTK